MSYEFSKDWFSPNIPVWTKMLESESPKRILEIGSFEGRSATWVMDNSNYKIHIDCVDTWEGSPEHVNEGLDFKVIETRFLNNIDLAQKNSKHGSTITAHKGLSSDILASMIVNKSEPYDLVYIDGSHAAQDCLTDAVMSAKLLRHFGIMVFDDYLWSEYWLPWKHRNPLASPKVGIDAFTTVFGRSFGIINTTTNTQVYLKRVG